MDRLILTFRQPKPNSRWAEFTRGGFFSARRSAKSWDHWHYFKAIFRSSVNWPCGAGNIFVITFALRRNSFNLGWKIPKHRIRPSPSKNPRLLAGTSPKAETFRKFWMVAGLVGLRDMLNLCFTLGKAFQNCEAFWQSWLCRVYIRISSFLNFLKLSHHKRVQAFSFLI